MTRERVESTARALGWAVLAFVGQAAVLVLTHAGRTVGYQHFDPLRAGSGLPSVAAGLLTAQTALVLVVAFSRRVEIMRVVRELLPGWRLPFVMIAFVLLSATVSREPMVYVVELMLGALMQMVQLATVVFAVVTLPSARISAFRRIVDSVLGRESDDVPSGSATFDRFVIIAAVWTTAVAYLLAVVSYQRHPHVPDEVVYLLHARYFAAGALSMPAPPVPEAFNIDLMTYDPTRWFSPVPPGWPAMLAVGAWLDAPWLVNPLLGGINVVLAYAVLREVYTRRTARLVVLLMCASPWVLFMAMNLMPHTFSLTCALVAALGVSRMRRGGSLLWAVAGGAALGVLSLIRPLEAAAAAALLGLWSLRARWRGVPLIPSALLTLSAAAVGALNLPYNKALTGNARRFPIMDYTDRMYGKDLNELGFGPNRGLGWSGLDPFPGHGLRDVVVNSNVNLTQLNVELLGWSCGSALVILVLLASGRLRRTDWQMLAIIATIIVIHAFYWFSGGPDFGPRYWWLIVVPCLALAARGLEEANLDVRATGARGGSLEVATLFAALALVVFVPWRATDKYFHYRGMRPDVRALDAERHFGPSLVLIRGNRHPDYHSAAIYNPLDLNEPVPVYARDLGKESRAKLLAAYPDRRVWILEGPSVTGDSFRVVAGPLNTSQVLALP